MYGNSCRAYAFSFHTAEGRVVVLYKAMKICSGVRGFSNGLAESLPHSVSAAKRHCPLPQLHLQSLSVQLQHLLLQFSGILGAACHMTHAYTGVPAHVQGKLIMFNVCVCCTASRSPQWVFLSQLCFLFTSFCVKLEPLPSGLVLHCMLLSSFLLPGRCSLWQYCHSLKMNGPCNRLLTINH